MGEVYSPILRFWFLRLGSERMSISIQQSVCLEKGSGSPWDKGLRKQVEQLRENVYFNTAVCVSREGEWLTLGQRS